MIPKASENAIRESFTTMGKDIVNLKDDAVQKRMHDFILEFKAKQPQIFDQLSYLFLFHAEHTKGICDMQQFTVYTILLINSLYIQQELNDIKKLFDYEPENPEDCL